MVDDPADGTQSHDATRIGDPADARTLVPTSSAAVTIELPPHGYEMGEAIGRGGMGEVIAAHDLRIGREVAIKRMTQDQPDREQIARFLREARIQARLEHPAIVPVHEMGVDELGRPFFTMKRLTGKTLGDCQRDGVAATRLLRAFTEVCRAIDFAHARGVVHRDLKPSNIMLGDYGEVYVIDWGIARVLRDDPEQPDANPDVGTLDEGTKTGALLGTPGYMSPEQIRGHRATQAADVYALGSILFELLAGEPLHKRGEPGILSTLSTPQVLPSTRRPERAIPPELDAACFGALAEDPTKRPTTRELADQVEAFLDGDRDLARRREIAAQQLSEAHALLDGEGPESRGAAMRRAGRALALDPESEAAAELVGALLLEPPRTLPPDLQRGLDEHERDFSRARSRRGVWSYLAVFAVLPLVFVIDIKNWAALIALYATISVAALSAARAVRTGEASVPVVLVVNLALVVLFSRISGPFVLTPLMVCATLVAITTIPWLAARTAVVFGWAVAAVVVPVALEWTGVLPPTWQILGERMVIISDIVRTRGTVDEVALVIGASVFTVIFAGFALAVSRRHRKAQEQLFIHAWHLRQLLPRARAAWSPRAS